MKGLLASSPIQETVSTSSPAVSALIPVLSSSSKPPRIPAVIRDSLLPPQTSSNHLYTCSPCICPVMYLYIYKCFAANLASAN